MHGAAQEGGVSQYTRSSKNLNLPSNHTPACQALHPTTYHNTKEHSTLMVEARKRAAASARPRLHYCSSGQVHSSFGRVAALSELWRGPPASAKHVMAGGERLSFTSRCMAWPATAAPRRAGACGQRASACIASSTTRQLCLRIDTWLYPHISAPPSAGLLGNRGRRVKGGCCVASWAVAPQAAGRPCARTFAV